MHFSYSEQRTAVISQPSSIYQESFPTRRPAACSAFANDPRNRVQYREGKYPPPPASPQQSVQNALVCFDMNSASMAAMSSPMQSSLMNANVINHRAPMNMLAEPEVQNASKLLYNYLQASPWFQSLMSAMKMQIYQTISQLVRALKIFHHERQFNVGAIFDIFKIECAGEILEILSNLGLVVDTNGMIMEDRKLSTYSNRSSALMQPHRGATVMPQRSEGMNAAFSFIQQVLASGALSASTSTSLSESFVSCYLDSPKPKESGIGCGGLTTCAPKKVGCCGAPTAGCCNVAGTTCPTSKPCGCSVNTTCMNHHNHQNQNHHQCQQHIPQNHQCQQHNHHQNTESHCDENCSKDNQQNQFRKPYQNNNDSFQRPSYNQRYNNNSRYSKPSSYSTADSNSPGRSGSPPPSTSSSSPPRGGGRGSGRGRGGGFGRYNKGPMRGGSGSGGGGRQSSSWSSSPPPYAENSYNSRRYNNKNNDNNINSSYNSNGSPNKTSTSPTQAQRSPVPSSPKKESGREGSPVLNSPARQQQQARPPSGDEECWD